MKEKRSFAWFWGFAAVILLGLLSACQSPLQTSGISPSAARAVGGYNYGEALQKSILFYEFQMSGKLPSWVRTNWRADSGLNDGADVGKDLTGGWYDAGDHVKFNLPMAYTSAMLSWSVVEAQAALTASGQLTPMLNQIRWVSEYLIRSHTAPNEFYYQVGDGGADHAWWGPAEAMQMARPSAKVTLAAPGSAVVGEAAAALAAAAVVFKASDPAFSASCLSHAKELYNFAETTKSDSGYTAAAGYYNSWSGWWDELSWAAVWLYLAGAGDDYLIKADQYSDKWNREPQTTTIAYKWAHAWDDVHIGAELLLAKYATDPARKAMYKTAIEQHLDWWQGGAGGIKYTPKGLAWLDQWGSLRYATTTAFLAGVYSNWAGADPSRVPTYRTFLKNQVDYALGSTGRSFEIGFGVNPPVRPHHRTAHGSWADSQTVPNYHRHTLHGALVGGPGSDDSYADDISNYTTNEVACDYNAGFTGALALLYGQFGGTPIPNFNAVETPTNDEYFVETAVNATGSNFIEIKGITNNQSGWPATVAKDLSFNYFLDLSELYAAGYTASDITVGSNYNQGATVTGPFALDAANKIYYVTVNFAGTAIYPGGQSAYKKEVQFRIAGPANFSTWNNANDYSFKGVSSSASSPTKNAYLALYKGSTLVWGSTPGGVVPTPTPTPSTTPTPTPTPTSTPTPTPTPSAETPYRTVFNVAGGVTIPASDYNIGGEGVAYHDSDAANAGGSYRNDGVDLEACSEGGYNVGWTQPGEWTDYFVSAAAAGTYKIDLRMAALGSGAKVHIELNGLDVTGSLSVPSTGAWQTYTTVTSPHFTIPTGTSKLRFVFDAAGSNLATIMISPAGVNPTPTPTASPSPQPGTLAATYTKNDWGSGFTGNIVITNNGTSAVSNWTLKFSFSGNQTINNFWSSSIVQNGQNVTVTPLSHNATIPAGGSVNFGFNAAYSGTNLDPANLTITY